MHSKYFAQNYTNFNPFLIIFIIKYNYFLEIHIPLNT